MQIRRILSLFCTLALLVCVFSACGKNPAPIVSDALLEAQSDERLESRQLKIVTYNTAAPWGNVLKGTSSGKRAPLFAEQMANLAPDSFGVQELNSDWASKMETLLPDYAFYGMKRGGDSKEKQSEMNGIYYLKSKYNLLQSDTFWISETPDTESRFEGAGCHRICSYVVLQNRVTGFTYAHFNTHFDNVSEEARTLGGTLIAERAAQLSEKYGEIAVVITGDFNQDSSGTACAVLQNAGYSNASAISPTGDAQCTYHAWGEYTEGKPIDFIFANNALRTAEYKIHTEKVNGTFVSDHYAVSAVFDII